MMATALSSSHAGPSKPAREPARVFQREIAPYVEALEGERTRARSRFLLMAIGLVAGTPALFALTAPLEGGWGLLVTVAVLAIGVNVLGSQQRKFRQRVRDLVMPAICQAVGELRHSAGEAADIPFDELERICATGALFRISPLIRDKIIHSGSLASPIFVTEKGFCVSPQDKPFADFGIWHESHYYHKNLVSLLPLVAHMVSRPSALAMILGAITQRDMILAADGCCAVT